MLEAPQNDQIKALINNNPHFSKSRLSSLYSNFANLKHLNPEGFEANIEAWSNLLHTIIRSQILTGSQLSISTFNPEITQLLSIPIYGQPNGLSTIFKELLQRKVLVPYTLYKDASESYTAKMNDSFGISDYLSPSKWLHWSAYRLGLSNSFNPTNKNGDLVPETYISWSMLRESAHMYIRHIEKEINNGSRSSLLFDKSLLFNFMKKFDPNLSQLDFEILFIYFSRDLGICCTKYQDGITYLKFRKNEDDDMSITEDDIGIVKLKVTILAIENRNNELEEKLSDISNKMKLILRSENASNDQGVKIKLRSMLSTKKMFLASLEKSSSALTQLVTTLLKINDATSNKNIFDILSQSSKVLKALNDSINLDDIDNLKIDLDESYDKTSIISGALTSGSPQTNDEELEEELDKLYGQETSKAAPEISSNNNEQNKSDLLQKLENMSIEDGISHKERETLEEAYN